MEEERKKGKKKENSTELQKYNVEAEEQISKLEDKMMETTAEEENKVKRMKRAEHSLRDLWDNIKCSNIQIIGVPEEEEKKKGDEKIS